MSSPPPIDAVIAWVDGRAPEHIKMRASYSDHSETLQATSPLASEVNAPRRWSYANELDICLRSIHRHAPWMRRIFIVTNGQVPQGLEDLPPALRAKVKIIDHTIIFEGHLDWLPTFNSIAIETMIWRIPDLAERFVYFNDDMFLAGPCTQELFFPEDGDKTTLMGKWMSVPDNKISKFKKSIYRSAKLNAAKAMGYSNTQFFSSAHVAMPMRVSVMKAMHDENSEWLERNASARFRGAEQYLVQGLFAHYIIKTDKATFSKTRFDQNLSASYCKYAPYLVFRINCALMKFWPKRFRLICVNDLSRLNERFSGKADGLIRKTIGIG